VAARRAVVVEKKFQNNFEFCPRFFLSLVRRKFWDRA
jgi:hypothetical protein